MRRTLAVIGAALAMAGLSPAVADSAPRQGLTLAPVRLFVADLDRIGPLYIYNAGDRPEPVTVTTSDAWLSPSETSFTLPVGDRRAVYADAHVPAVKDAGEHVSQVTFTTSLTDTGPLRAAVALAAAVVFGPYGSVKHDLRIFGLSAPLIADSWDAPAVNLTLEDRGNVHESVTIAPFGQVLLLRGETRVLSLRWTSHPVFGLGTIAAGGQRVSTLFLPWHATAGGMLVLLGLYTLLRLLRRRPAHP